MKRSEEKKGRRIRIEKSPMRSRQIQSPPKECGAKCSKGRPSEPLNDVQGSARHREIMGADGSVSGRDRGDADGGLPHTSNQERCCQHEELRSVTRQIDKRQCTEECQQRAARGNSANAEPAGQSAHRRIYANHPKAEGSHEPAHLTRRAAAGSDQVDRDEHLSGEQGAVGQELGCRGCGEDLAAEKAEIYEGFFSPASCGPDKTCQQKNRGSQRQQTLVVADMIHSVKKQSEAHRQQRKTDPVQISRPNVSTVLGQ